MVDIIDKVLWFCEACGQANKVKDVDCKDCGSAFTKDCLVFNIETFSGIYPKDAAQTSSFSPYWHDGGPSSRKPYAAWGDE